MSLTVIGQQADRPRPRVVPDRLAHVVLNIEDLVRRFHAGEDEKPLIAYKYDHEND
jgi:hypothetical protein